VFPLIPMLSLFCRNLGLLLPKRREAKPLLRIPFLIKFETCSPYKSSDARPALEFIHPNFNTNAHFQGVAMRLITSESVTEGHPDRVCEQIADHILDALLARDINARVAVETIVTTGLVRVVGELTTDTSD